MSDSKTTKPYFRIVPKDGYILGELHLSALHGDNFESLVHQFDQQITSTLTAHKESSWILFCEGLEGASKRWILPLLKLACELQLRNRALRLVGPGQTLEKFLNSQILGEFLVVADSLKTAMVQCDVPGSKNFNVLLINPIIDSAINILKMESGLEVSATPIQIKQFNAPLSGEISGMISLSNSVFTALILLTFPEATIQKIVSKMLNEVFNETTTEVESAASDLLNLIFDQARMSINNKGSGIEAAQAGMLIGKAGPSLWWDKGSRFAIPFETAAGNFAVEVYLLD